MYAASAKRAPITVMVIENTPNRRSGCVFPRRSKIIFLRVIRIALA